MSRIIGNNSCIARPGICCYLRGGFGSGLSKDEKVYGDKKIVVQTYKDRFLPGLANKCEVLSVKLRQKAGIDL